MAESIPSFSQNNISGRISWFGGPHDATDSGHTASGGTTKEPGIAVYNRATLGGYWKVRAPNGKTAIVKQTDLGPAPWTGKKIDFTYSVLNQFGYNEGNFPTGSNASAQYLGKTLPKGMAAGNQQAQGTSMIPGQPGRTTEIPGFPATQGTRATTQLNFDTAGYQKARNEAEVNKTILGLFKGSERGGLRPVFPGTMPQIGQFLKSKTIPGTPGSPGLASKTISEPGKAERLGGPGTSGRVPAGHELHGLLPAGAKVLEWNRKDQGRDLQLTPGQVLLATGNGYVIRNGVDPAGFGPDYPIIHLTSGPEAGKDVYYGHTDSLVKSGQKLVAGQPVAKTSKTGHNAKPGWLEYGYAPGGTPGPFGQETPF